jgi:hypothetical protein
MIEKIVVVIGVLGFMLGVFALLGVLLAWLFAQFGIVYPWYVYGVAWFVLGLLAHTIRGGK